MGKRNFDIAVHIRPCFELNQMCRKTQHGRQGVIYSHGAILAQAKMDKRIIRLRRHFPNTENNATCKPQKNFHKNIRLVGGVSRW